MNNAIPSMGKNKYTAEFEIKASDKILFPYLSTPGGLAQWFADEVNMEPDKIFNFRWDDAPHYARLTVQRPNKLVRFEFAPHPQQISEDPAYIEFRLDRNEMTLSSFLNVTDYSDEENTEDLNSVWTNLVSNLREVVSGRA
jgi:uncharacterized protein YndB with AHSA1/START domain